MELDMSYDCGDGRVLILRAKNKSKHRQRCTRRSGRIQDWPGGDDDE